MATLIRRAITFAIATLIVVIALDAIVSGAGWPPLARLPLYAAALVLSLLGATAGFACVRRRLPTKGQAIFLGVGFGLTSLFGGVVMNVAEGPLLAGLWLLLGSIAFAIGGALLAKPWRSGGHI